MKRMSFSRPISLHNESKIKFDLSAYGCTHMYQNDREKNVIMMQCHPSVRCGGRK